MVKTNKVITLIAKADSNVEDVAVKGVTSYSVGYKVIYIEYGTQSVMAVARADYERMTVSEEQIICIDSSDPDFERINCRDMI